MQRFHADQLQEFTTAVYRQLGLTETAASTVADTLVQADLWGHQSHGVMRTFWYADRLRSGATQINATPELVVDGGAIAVVDGGDGQGQVVAKMAMTEAIKRAKQHGVGVVAVRRSGHFGTAMYFTRMAADADCIGFLSTNASPAMAPWGGVEKRVGTNPWSIAAPAGRYAPMMLDIANTAVARGKLYLAAQKNQPIPDDWAIDSLGNPTTDAAAGIAGTILPFAGHKGYAIATMMDVLSGVLSGSGFGADVVGPYTATGSSGVGHLAIALDIAAFRPLADYHADMAHLIDDLKMAPKAAGTEEIFYPGEPESQAEQLHRQIGMALPPKTVQDLNQHAADMGLPPLSD